MEMAERAWVIGGVFGPERGIWPRPSRGDDGNETLGRVVFGGKDGGSCGGGESGRRVGDVGARQEGASCGEDRSRAVASSRLLRDET